MAYSPGARLREDLLLNEAPGYIQARLHGPLLVPAAMALLNNARPARIAPGEYVIKC